MPAYIPNAACAVDPVLNVPFNDAMADISGNGLHLSALSGTALYGDSYPGFRGMTFSRTFSTGAPLFTVGRTSNDTALTITGGLTVAMLMKQEHNASSTTNNFYYTFGGNGAGTTQNILYEARYDGGGLTSPASIAQVSMFHEGVTAHTPVDPISCGKLCVFFMIRRISGGSAFYRARLDTRQMGAESSGLALPSDGTASRLVIGGSESLGATSGIWTLNSFVLWDTDLTDDDCDDVYASCLGF